MLIMSRHVASRVVDSTMAVVKFKKKRKVKADAEEGEESESGEEEEEGEEVTLEEEMPGNKSDLGLRNLRCVSRIVAFKVKNIDSKILFACLVG